VLRVRKGQEGRTPTMVDVPPIHMLNVWKFGSCTQTPIIEAIPVIAVPGEMNVPVIPASFIPLWQT
jgi:hypothetical protein